MNGSFWTAPLVTKLYRPILLPAHTHILPTETKLLLTVNSRQPVEFWCDPIVSCCIQFSLIATLKWNSNILCGGAAKKGCFLFLFWGGFFFDILYLFVSKVVKNTYWSRVARMYTIYFERNITCKSYSWIQQNRIYGQFQQNIIYGQFQHIIMCNLAIKKSGSIDIFEVHFSCLSIYWCHRMDKINEFL